MGPPIRVLTSFNPLEFTTADELPKGYLLIHVKGVGEMYADPKMLRLGSEYRHDPFPPEVRERMRYFETAFKGVYEPDAGWEDGFRRDRHPWAEIAIQDVFAEGTDRFTGHLTKGAESTLAKRKEVYNLLLMLFNNGLPKGKFEFGSYGSLTAKRVKEIADWLFSPERHRYMAERRKHYRDLIRPNPGGWQKQFTLSAMLNEDGTGFNNDAEESPRELVETADVILGLDTESQKRFPILGRDRIGQIADGADPAGSRILTVEVDADTDDLERLVAMVEVNRGHSEYGRPGQGSG